MAAGILLHFSTKVHFSFHSGNNVYCCTIVGKNWQQILLGKECGYPLLREANRRRDDILWGFTQKTFHDTIIAILWDFPTEFSTAAFWSLSVMFSASPILFSVTFQSTASTNIPKYILNCPGRKQFFYLKLEKKIMILKWQILANPTAAGISLDKWKQLSLTFKNITIISSHIKMKSHIETTVILSLWKSMATVKEAERGSKNLKQCVIHHDFVQYHVSNYNFWWVKWRLLTSFSMSPAQTQTPLSHFLSPVSVKPTSPPNPELIPNTANQIFMPAMLELLFTVHTYFRLTT